MRFIFLTLLIAYASSAFAEDIITQDELIVSATGIETPLHETGTKVNIITAEDLEKGQIIHLSDALRDTGINVARSGGLGTQSNVFLRGLPGRYTTLIMDGISFFDPGANQVLWNNVMTQGLERIEIVRGSHGVLYGSNAVAGVVVADTKIGGKTSFGFESEGGSFASWRTSANISGNIANSDYGLSLSYFDTDGISAAEEDNGNTEEDGYQNFTARGRAQTALSDNITLELAGYNATGEANYDGGFPLGDTTNREEFQRYAARIGLRYAGDMFGHRVSAQHYHSDVDEVRDERTQGTRAASSLRINYDGDVAVRDNLRFAWGAAHITNRFENTVLNFLGAPSFNEHDIEAYGVYGIGHFKPTQRLAITAAARYDEHELFDGHTTWRLSAAYHLNNRFTLRGLYATGYRAPSLFELFAAQYGNRDLEPETSESREIGVDFYLAPNITTSLTIFNIKVDDLIGFHPQTFQSIQVRGRTHAQGLEAGFVAKWQYLDTKFNLAYSDVENANGTRGVRVPLWQANLALDFKPTEKLTIGTSLNHTRDTVDVGNTALDDYYLLGVRVRYDITDNFSIFARGENLLDDDYQIVNGYGTAGSAGYVGLRAKF